MNKDKLRIILQKIGFNEEIIEEILELVDSEIDLEYLYEKVKYLTELKCTDRIVRIIIEENPLFLTTELDDIKDVINYLNEKGLQDYIVNILEVNPDILSTGLEKIRQNEKVLKYLIENDKKVDRLLIDRSEIFTYNNDYLANRIRLLVENGLKDKIEKIILLYPEVFELEDDEININELKQKV